MNLRTALAVYAGGPGSGCNPEKGRCGRKPGAVMQRVRELKSTLLKHGGRRVIYYAPDSVGDPYIESGRIAAEGRLWSGGQVSRVLMKLGAPNSCHDNVCARNLRRLGIAPVTGYALDESGIWHRHSWGIRKDGRLVETTFKPKAYFGVVLRGKDATDFYTARWGAA